MNTSKGQMEKEEQTAYRVGSPSPGSIWRSEDHDLSPRQTLN